MSRVSCFLPACPEPGAAASAAASSAQTVPRTPSVADVRGTLA